jgi:hypothetical protein
VSYADVAQLVEHLLAMQKAVGSSPIIRFQESPAQAGFFVFAFRRRGGGVFESAPGGY